METAEDTIIPLPSPAEVLEARRTLGAMLHDKFAMRQLSDRALLGDRLSHEPSLQRKGIPYHPAVVQAWLSGEAALPRDVLAAMKNMLKAHTDQEWRTRVDALHAVANFDLHEAHKQLSQRLMDRLGLDITGFAHQIEEFTDGDITLSKVKNELAGSRDKHPASAHLLQAMGELLVDHHHIPPEDAEAVLATYRALHDLYLKVPHQDEFAMLLDRYMHGVCPTKKEFSERIRPLCAISDDQLSSWCRAFSRPAPDVIAAMDRFFAKQGVDCQPPLGALTAWEARRAADALWSEAVGNHDFGMMLQACRTAYGHSQESFIERLHAHGAVKITKATLHKWEVNRTRPAKDSFPKSDVTTVYSTTLKKMDAEQHVPPISDNFGPWWSKERDATIRRTLEDIRAQYGTAAEQLSPATRGIKKRASLTDRTDETPGNLGRG